MSRLLECVFVLGCAVVGFCMDAKEGSVMQDAVKISVQLVSNVHDHIAANAARFSAGLASVPSQVLGHVRMNNPIQ
jgi:hypothetical protein